MISLHDFEKMFRLNGESHLLLNPRLPEDEAAIYQKFFRESSDMPDHLWMLSSGSSRQADESSKLIGLSKQAFLSSAAATNRHLNISGRDRWAAALPHFHVGGLSIYARCLLADATAVGQPLELQVGGTNEERARRFTEWVSTEKITVLSLVPTQIFDLVAAACVSPVTLRAVMLGGAALDPGLYRHARSLGWPLLPSYGMTETSSNIATASLASLAENQQTGIPAMAVLDHVEVRNESAGQLSVRGASLLTGYWQRVRGVDEFTDPKIMGWYTTSDLAEVEGSLSHQQLRPKGRATDFVKIKGEGVDVASLRGRFNDFLRAQNFTDAVALIDLPEPRDGAKIIMAFENPQMTARLQTLVAEWNRRAFPPERISKSHRLVKIPRSDLGKVLWPELRRLLVSAEAAV